MPLLMCPNDNAPMQTLDRHGVQFDMCPTCRGVWLDRGELEKLMESATDELTRGVLAIHADRAATGKRELHLLQRFTASHPRVPIVGVPALPFEVADVTALRAVAEQITGRG